MRGPRRWIEFSYPRSHALRGNGLCAAPRRACRQLRELIPDPFVGPRCHSRSAHFEVVCVRPDADPLVSFASVYRGLERTGNDGLLHSGVMQGASRTAIVRRMECRDLIRQSVTQRDLVGFSGQSRGIFLQGLSEATAMTKPAPTLIEPDLQEAPGHRPEDLQARGGEPLSG